MQEGLTAVLLGQLPLVSQLPASLLRIHSLHAHDPVQVHAVSEATKAQPAQQRGCMKELRGGQHTHQRKTTQSKHVLMLKSQLDFSKSCSDATSLKPTNLLPVTIATAAPHAASLCNCQCVAVATCHGHNPQVRLCGQVGTQGYVHLQDKAHTHNGLVKYRF